MVFIFIWYLIFNLKDVRGLADDYRIFEARYHYFNTQKLISLAFQKRAQEEVKLYTKNSSDKSFRLF
jgi:hypothetical protein